MQVGQVYVYSQSARFIFNIKTFNSNNMYYKYLNLLSHHAWKIYTDGDLIKSISANDKKNYEQSKRTICHKLK